MAGSPRFAKRLRLSLPLQEQRDGHDAGDSSRDIIQFFAERGSRALDLERDNQQYADEIRRLQTSCRAAEQELALLKVNAKFLSQRQRYICTCP